MALHYLLDGYNIIHQAPGLAVLNLEEARAALVRWINAHRPQGSAQNAVTVVFDGSARHFGRMEGGAVRVVFTDGGSADDHIKAAVEGAGQKKKFVVVSDDKGIKLYVRALGAGVLSVRQFAPGLFGPAGGKKNGGKRPEGAAGTSKKISLTEAHKINKELEDRWLK